MPKRVVVGIVTGDKMAKTRRVEIARLVKHPKYKKYVRRRTICYVHDEDEQSNVGDTVEIIETRPLSKLKRWQLVRVLKQSTAVDMTALRAAAAWPRKEPTGNSHAGARSERVGVTPGALADGDCPGPHEAAVPVAAQRRSNKVSRVQTDSKASGHDSTGNATRRCRQHRR